MQPRCLGLIVARPVAGDLPDSWASMSALTYLDLDANLLNGALDRVG